MEKMSESVVQGPLWCEPGLNVRGGRYPLSVEAPVLRMVDTLVPGVSTLTRFARYYTLYWALADFAEKKALDPDTCRTALRRAEVLLAWVSLENDSPGKAHGIDAVQRLVDQGAAESMAEPGAGSYSPRQWGFWSQYNGPSVTLGTVTVDGGALRSGRHSCPPSVQRMFRDLLRLVASRPVHADDIPQFAEFALDNHDMPDVAALRELMTATVSGYHEPDDWIGNDHTRRASLRILARSAQLHSGTPDWAAMLRDVVAYGNQVHTDPVLSEEDQAPAWRGTLLRHQSVGAWRRLWAGLVEQVRAAAGSAAREDLYDWVTANVPDVTVRQFVADSPDTTDAAGNPLPAEERAYVHYDDVLAELAVLLLGSLRKDELSGRALQAFLGHGRGRRRGRGQFLAPEWVAYRRCEHESQTMQTFARAIVDDMLAQSQRVAQGKLTVDKSGRMTLFSKLHERNGRYFADSVEGSGNVGLRVEQLGGLARQLGLIEYDQNYAVSGLGARTLGLPE